MKSKLPYNTKFFSSRSKYGSKKTIVDNIKFDSKWEAERYGQLKAMERAMFIRDLELQVPYDIVVNDVKICRYVADFRYKKESNHTITNDEYYVEVVEDAKGFETPEFKLKKKLMKAVFNIDIYLSKKK
jgi:hypothetical protein|tara:strand:+ start:707 stop:1093 length:387 start_codon:yes stop_codon:yes gene_type:complete